MPTAQELHGCKVSLFLQAELVEKQSFPEVVKININDIIS
jgi:hypothetical protein